MHRRALLAVLTLAACPLAAQQTPIPQWQTAAGGKQTFAVAAIRQSQAGAHIMPNFPNTADDAYVSGPNTSYIADSGLLGYIQFAYKLSLTADEMHALQAKIPAWASSDMYQVRARSDQPATKDQMRLMVQSLLADRFHLAVHFESKETPVYALTLVAPGQTGPRLRPHSEGLPCDAGSEASAKVFPPVCEQYIFKITADNTYLRGARNTTLGLLADSFNSNFNMLYGIDLDRPVVDQTGLTGRYDLVIEWSPDQKITFANGRVMEPGIAPLIRDALQKQLGLKLAPTRTAQPILTIDHVEKPTEN